MRWQYKSPEKNYLKYIVVNGEVNLPKIINKDSIKNDIINS